MLITVSVCRAIHYSDDYVFMNTEQMSLYTLYVLHAKYYVYMHMHLYMVVCVCTFVCVCVCVCFASITTFMYTPALS